MQATAITDPWNSGESDRHSADMGTLSTDVQTGDIDARTGPIREWVENLLASIGLTMDDLKVLTTVGNAVGLMAAVASLAGWI